MNQKIPLIDTLDLNIEITNSEKLLEFINSAQNVYLSNLDILTQQILKNQLLILRQLKKET